MEFRSNEDNVAYFVWPDINVFDGSGNVDLFWRRFERVMSTIVTPAVSLFGVTGNVTSIIILVRGQLTKSSVLLILALAVADTSYLLGTNNVAIQLYVSNDQFGFDYPEKTAHFLFYLYLFQMTIDLIGKVSSMILPCLITFDRLVAVWAPLRYNSVMTVKRVRAAICTVFFTSTVIFIFYSLKFSFLFTPLSSINGTSLQNSSNGNEKCLGLIVKSEFYLNFYTAYQTIVKTVVFIYGPVPLALTVAGCIVVYIRINITENNRRTLLANFSKTKPSRVRDTIPGCLRRVFQRSSEDKQRDHCETIQTVSIAMQIIAGEDIVSIEEGDPSLDVDQSHSNSHIDDVLTHATTLSADVGVQDIEINTTTTTPCKHAKTSKLRKSKTTRTLLSVCCVYCIANTINFVVLFHFDASNSSPNLAVALEMSRRFVLVLNSACNFLFYVGLNQNFRESYTKVFALCRSSLRK